MPNNRQRSLATTATTLATTAVATHPNHERPRPPRLPETPRKVSASMLLLLFGSMLGLCWLVTLQFLALVRTTTTQPPQALVREVWQPPPDCDPTPAIFVNHTVVLDRRPCQPISIAFAISLVKCGDRLSTPAGMVDAALVLRHSIYQNTRQQHYTAQMYVLVHQDAVQCSHGFAAAGLNVIVKPPPVLQREIREGTHLRKTIHREKCCGSDEFVKLYAYSEFAYDNNNNNHHYHPVVVHVDIDFVVNQPLDDLLDVLLYHKDSAVGRAARARVARERPHEPWPEQPQALLTRDWPQVIPGRKAGFQAGFLVVRSNPHVLDELVDIVKEGDYVGDFSRSNGWGGQGYGGFVGAMAMQGLIAYYYDVKAPDTWVELDQCRHNHLGMDVRFHKGGPGYRPKKEWEGKCRNNQAECQECRYTPTDQIYSVHYSPCRKPWNCIGIGDSVLPDERKPIPKRTGPEKEYIPESYVDLQHCMELHKIWHTYRTDLEQQLLLQPSLSLSERRLLNDTIARARSGAYKRNVFQGHCANNGEYLTLSSASGGNHSERFLKQVQQLYN